MASLIKSRDNKKMWEECMEHIRSEITFNLDVNSEFLSMLSAIDKIVANATSYQVINLHDYLGGYVFEDDFRHLEGEERKRAELKKAMRHQAIDEPRITGWAYPDEH